MSYYIMAVYFEIAEDLMLYDVVFFLQSVSLINLTLRVSYSISLVICMIVLSWSMYPHRVQYVSSCCGSCSMLVPWQFGHIVVMCLWLYSYVWDIVSYFHIIVRTIRIVLVLFCRLRFVLFLVLVLGLGWVLVLLSVCLFFGGLFCLCSWCSSGGRIFCVFLVGRVFYRFRCSMFGGYGVSRMVFRSRHILLLGI